MSKYSKKKSDKTNFKSETIKKNKEMFHNDEGINLTNEYSKYICTQCWLFKTTVNGSKQMHIQTQQRTPTAHFSINGQINKTENHQRRSRAYLYYGPNGPKWYLQSI